MTNNIDTTSAQYVTNVYTMCVCVLHLVKSYTKNMSYSSQWATMYDDDEFLISPEDVARAAKKRAEEDEEILQLLSSLDNGSHTEDEEPETDCDWETTDWDAVIKQFLTSYKIGRVVWQEVLSQIKQMKHAEPSKTFTCQDLVAIAQDIKKKKKNIVTKKKWIKQYVHNMHIM